jgi:hypothetical protein
VLTFEPSLSISNLHQGTKHKLADNHNVGACVHVTLLVCDAPRLTLHAPLSFLLLVTVGDTEL